jgi:putative FmdB family regulatory protein
MPSYDYLCTACEREFEVFQSIKDEPLTVCERCGEPSLKRLIGAGAGILFKGSGFYQTDYKKSPAKHEKTAGGDSKEKAAGGKAGGAKDKPSEQG